MSQGVVEAAHSVGARRTLFYAILVAFSLRLIVVAFVYKGFLDPGRDHWEFGYEIGRVARSIVAGHGFGNPYRVPTGPTALLTPVFPYFFAGIFAIFGVCSKASALVILTLNCWFSALTCLPVFFVARMSFGLRTARWASWAWAFLPYAVNFSADTMWYHSFVALLLALLFWIGLRLESSDRIWAWAGFGFLFGFSALTTPVILAIAPFLGGWICYRLARQGKNWTRAATAGSLALIITIAPWLIRNDHAFHRPVFLKDNFWMEVCIGNLGNSLHWWNGNVHPSGSTAEMDQYQRLREMDYMAEKRSRALAFIEANPGTYLVRSIRRVVYMWTGFWSFNREYLREEPLDPENIAFLTSFTVLSLIGLYKAFRMTPAIAMPYFVVLLSFPSTYYLSHPDPGFRHPMDPLLTILACSAIVSWLPSRPKPAQTKAPKIFTPSRSLGASGTQTTRLPVACRVESCPKLASSVTVSIHGPDALQRFHYWCKRRNRTGRGHSIESGSPVRGFACWGERMAAHSESNHSTVISKNALEARDGPVFRGAEIRDEAAGMRRRGRASRA